MGLRIIGRRPPSPPVEVSESELLASLAHESSAWPATRDYKSVDVQRQFMEKFRRVKARMAAPGEVAACAVRVREQLTERQLASAVVHSPVDVATLLELL